MRLREAPSLLFLPLLVVLMASCEAGSGRPSAAPEETSTEVHREVSPDDTPSFEVALETIDTAGEVVAPWLDGGDLGGEVPAPVEDVDADIHADGVEPEVSLLSRVDHGDVLGWNGTDRRACGHL